MITGTAALIAVAAVFTLAIATMVRRSATAISIVIVTVVIPYVLAVPPGAPAGFAGWLLRVTPAAAFAVQQAMPQYHQVLANYTPRPASTRWRRGPVSRCSAPGPLLALAGAGYLLKRRDA